MSPWELISGSEDLAQSVPCLPHKHEVLSLKL